MMEKLSMDALNRLSLDDFKRREKIPLVFILDNIRSGLNVGSIFRTADAFALEGVVLCGITAQPPHREILKTALGSTQSVAWRYQSSVLDAVSEAQKDGFTVLALEQTSRKTWLQEWKPEPGRKYALLLGNEVDGIDNQALALCNGAIEIPQLGTKHSLNVAVAAGVAAWEFARNFMNQPL